MAKKKGDNPSKFVTHAECAKTVESVKLELKTMKNALVGEDMRGGIVKDVQEIKSATGIIKTVIVPIVLSVSSALIVYVLLHA